MREHRIFNNYEKFRSNLHTNRNFIRTFQKHGVETLHGEKNHKISIKQIII